MKTKLKMTQEEPSREVTGSPGAPDIERWRNPELAASETPRAQAGTWTLTAPDGRMFTGDSPIRCCTAEQRERVPAAVALARIAQELDEDDHASD